MPTIGIILAVIAVVLLGFIIWALCRVSTLCDNEDPALNDPPLWAEPETEEREHK